MFFRQAKKLALSTFFTIFVFCLNTNQSFCFIFLLSATGFIFSAFTFGLKARFHYEREIEHSLVLLLIFSRLKSKRALNEAKKINKTNKKILYFTLVVKNESAERSKKTNA